MPINVQVELILSSHRPGVYVFLFSTLHCVYILSRVARKPSNLCVTCSSPKTDLGVTPTRQ